MKLDRPVMRFWPSPIVAILGLLGALEPAYSECLSPSAASGATATTVFRCTEQPGTARQDQLAVSTEKTTVVERGPSDVPWFVPKAAENSTGSVEAPEVQAPLVQAPEVQPPKTEVKIAEEKIEVKPEKKPSATKKTIRKKLVKLKPAKTKTTKALTTKAKPEKRISKAKAKAKVAQEKPEKPDENTVVWTRKDMPVGNRIVNWLGL